MAFRLPESSDIPSTPASQKNRSIFTQPSTTPAGPPPSHLTHPSTTPAGPPPRSVFGSSFNPANTTFPRVRNTPLKGFAVPESSPPREEYDEDAQGSEDDGMDGAERFGSKARSPGKSAFMGSMVSSPRGLKRSRNGQPRPESNMPAIARAFTAGQKIRKLQETDDMILGTEQFVGSLDAQAQQLSQADLYPVITDSAVQLSKLWSKHSDVTTKEGMLGPASDDLTTKANYLSSLLLQLHHPHTTAPATTASNTRLNRSTAISKRSATSSVPLPRALLDWLSIYHNPFPDDFDAIHLHQPSPSANDAFWDLIYGSILRGRYDRVMALLRDAGWDNAATAQDDGSGLGYEGQQLYNTEEVVARCIKLLQSCPAVRYDDWDVKGNDWAVFRQRVRHTMNELIAFAEGDNKDREADRPNMFAQSAAGSLSAASRRAEARVPWSIYENLKTVYGMLLGGIDEIMLPSQDWLEACIYLTVWWDGEEEVTAPSASLSRSHMRKSAQQKPREVDIQPLVAYRKRLGDALALVTTEPEDAVFSVDTMDPVQVGLACVMEDNVEATLGILKSWSMTITSAVVELAAWGGWLPEGRPRSRGLLEQGFSSEDLMVLSHGPGAQPPQGGGIERDGILAQYAGLLAQRDVLKSSNGKVQREGWELCIQVLTRLDEQEVMQRQVGEVLDAIELGSEEEADKVLRICGDLGLAEQGRIIAERYADHLAENTQAYGAALTYYARARATAKVKSTLSLLTSLCLIQSAASPSSAQLDEGLAALLSKDRSGLVALARADTEAATSLSEQLSGYATVRRFYELRDQDVDPSVSARDRLRPLERRREAAKALIALIESAADCIRGGLFDPAVESVISTDGLLALLGETLPLLGQEKRVFTQPHVMSLLRIVEDFATAPKRIQESADELLKASLNAYRGDDGRSGMLGKSKSSLSNQSSGLSGSSYDMLASSVMLKSQEKGASGNGNAAQEIKRGWDWRKGLDGVGGVEFGGKEVLMLVRLALAQEVARGWGGKIHW